MPLLDSHPSGMPVWIDVMVKTSEQRERLMSFYSSLFEWTWDVGAEEIGFYSIAQHAGRPVMGLGQSPAGEGHMVTYFSTDDIEASAKKATELGGNVFMPPMQVMDLGSMSLALDPTGAVHGLWQPKSFAGFGVVYEANSPGWFDHVSKDPDLAASYYSGLTGHPVIEPEPGMKILQAGDQWFASISYDQLEDRPSQWNPIYVADSLQRIRDLVSEMGGTVVLEEMPVPGSAITVVVEPVMGTFVTVMKAGEAPS